MTDSGKKFKVVLLGDAGVGKSSIVQQYVFNKYANENLPTIGASFMSKHVTLMDEQDTILLQIWDTAGQERYKALTPMYYRDAHAAICVYDITNAESFKGVQDWAREV